MTGKANERVKETIEEFCGEKILNRKCSVAIKIQESNKKLIYQRFY